MKEPQRTCVSCRRVGSRRSLVRLSRRATGEVVVDPRQQLPGRGAYVCPEAACLARGLDRGRLGHAFRKPCEVRANLAEEVRARWQQPR